MTRTVTQFRTLLHRKQALSASHECVKRKVGNHFRDLHLISQYILVNVYSNVLFIEIPFVPNCTAVQNVPFREVPENLVSGKMTSQFVTR